jgi:hypothetical protein
MPYFIFKGERFIADEAWTDVAHSFQKCGSEGMWMKGQKTAIASRWKWTIKGKLLIGQFILKLCETT